MMIYLHFLNVQSVYIMFMRKTQEWCPEDLDLASGDDKKMSREKRFAEVSKNLST